MKIILAGVVATSIFLFNSTAKAEQRVRLMDVISEPEGGIKRTVFLKLNDNDEIDMLR